ncbi:MAG TPA: M20/M25/M40 family metallo-hydrolase [Thermoanaerobaculia bacterium]|nr:M20/M25/M40 family metallo-hydrolase [Thermoanaerobaculia bacterium]
MSRRRYSPFERRQRLAARVALYGSLALALAATAGGFAYLRRPLETGAAGRWRGVDYASLPEVRLLREYVRINTSDTGDQAAGARFLVRQLAARGVPATLERVGDRANVYAVLEGRDRRALVLHNHIDTEPEFHSERWLFPPFSAHIEGPWVYGRGTFDMKSLAVAQLLAVAEMKRRGRPLARSLVFLATNGEETGSELGTRWVIARHPRLVARAWAVLTEGGAVEVRQAGDVKYWGIELAQKRYLDLLVCADERAPLDELAAALRARGQPEGRLRLTPEVAAFLRAYAPSRDDRRLRALLAAPAALVRDLAAFRRLPGYLQAMLRDEVALFPVREAPGGGWQMLLKLHLLPGSDAGAALAELVPRWLTWGLRVQLRDDRAAAHGSPPDHPALRAVEEAVRAAYPGAAAGPLFLPRTATDARFFRAAGVPSYGFSPFPTPVTDTLIVGGGNERISLPAYVEGVELYRRLVERLVAAP